MATVLTVIFYLAFAVFVVGVALKVVSYARTPAPLIIPTTPAPRTTGGVVWRMAREVLFFESLFKSNLWLWACGIIFHFGLLLVALRHLRYFIQPVPEIIVFIQPFGIYGGMAMAAGLLGLWVRRIFVERIRYISTPSDHLMLALLLVIAITGLVMKYVAHTDIVAVKNYFIGLINFAPQQLPLDPPLLVHLSLAALLLIIFPFSKLLHAPGFFFSPTRNQADNPREARHLSSWAAQSDNNASADSGSDSSVSQPAS